MKAAIYCRLSEEDRIKQSPDDESASIQNQKSMLIRYATEQGWEIYGVYSDEDFAGADRNRPAFRRLLADAEAHLFDIVLCKTQSRFTRELELVETYLHRLFPRWGIRFVSVVDRADTDSQDNKKSRQINGLINEWYLEDLSANIRSVLTNRRRNGLHIGAFALYGYRKDPDRKGHLLIDPEAAEIVREIFTRFSQGYGKSAIARLLNDRGVPNPTEYKRLHGLRYRQPKRPNAALWKYAAISNTLRNEMYAGTMVQGKYGSVSYKTRQNRPRPETLWYRVPHTHEAIIDPELWERVQNLLRQRVKPFQSGAVGVFARKTRCAFCGYVLRSAGSRGRRYLQCPNRRVSASACVGAFVSVAALETLVTAEWRRIVKRSLPPDALNAVSVPDTLRQRRRLLSDMSVWKRKLADASRAIRDLYLDKTRGVLSETEFLSLKESFSDENARLSQLLLDAQTRLQALSGADTSPQALPSVDSESQALPSAQTPSQNLSGADTKSQALSGADTSPQALSSADTSPQNLSGADTSQKPLCPQPLTREWTDSFIDYIVVGKRQRGEKFPPVEIHWNF